MKICLIGPVYPYRGGIAHFTSLLALSLTEHSHPVLIISFKRQYPSWLYPGKSDKDPSQTALTTNAEYLLDSVNPLSWWKAFNRIIKYNPDLVIIQWWTTFFAIMFASLSKLLHHQNYKIIFLIHNVLPHEPKIFDPFLARVALSYGDMFIVLSEREKKRLNELLPNINILTTSLPQYDFLAGDRIDQDIARKRLNLPLEGRVALFFGIVRPYKGLIYLIEAIGILKNQGEIINLLIAGEFWEDVREYSTQIEKLGLTSQIKIINQYIPNEEIGALFSTADLFVAPYVDGTQSATLRIATAFNLPIIMTQVIKEANIISDYDNNCYIVPSKDSYALARAIVECINNLPNKVLKNKKNNNGWDEMVKIIEKIGIEKTK